MACQIRIAQDPAALLAAFPFDNGEDYENLYLVWISIARDVFERNLEPPDERQDVSLWQSRVHAVLQRVEQITYASASGRIWSLATWGYRIGLALVCVGEIVVFTHMLLLLLLIDEIPTAVSVAIVFAFIGGGVFLNYRLFLRFIKPPWARFCRNKELECHHKFWRTEFAEFLQRSQLDYFEVRGLLYNCDITGLSTANRAVEFYQRDYALPMFSTAQRFVV